MLSVLAIWNVALSCVAFCGEIWNMVSGYRWLPASKKSMLRLEAAGILMAWLCFVSKWPTVALLSSVMRNLMRVLLFDSMSFVRFSAKLILAFRAF